MGIGHAHAWPAPSPPALAGSGLPCRPGGVLPPTQMRAWPTCPGLELLPEVTTLHRSVRKVQNLQLHRQEVDLGWGWGAGSECMR